MPKLTATTTATETAAEHATNLSAATETTIKAVAASGKAAFEGVVAIDKAVFGYGRVAFEETLDHLRKAAALRDVAELIEANQAFAKSRFETVSAQGRELVELTRTEVENTFAPLREIVPSLKAAA